MTDRKRKGHWQQTYTGQKFWVMDPRPEEVHIADIAHHLSLLCRWAGAPIRYYCVAEHCIHVSRLVKRKHALKGLLHDSAEAYTGDMIRPLKVELAPLFKPIETRLLNTVFDRFGLSHGIPKSLDFVDKQMADDERRCLLRNPIIDNRMLKGGELPPGVGIDLYAPMSADEAEQAFLKRFRELTS